MLKVLTSTEGTIPDELSSNTERTGYTKQHGVELHLMKTVVGQESTRMGVDIRPRVLRLASLKKDVRDDVVDLADELEERVLGEVLESELALSSVAGVGLAQDGVAIAGNDLAALESGPDVFLDGLIGSIGADLVLHLLEPDEHFLVGQTKNTISA